MKSPAKTKLKKRAYDASSRREAAEATRRAILDVARSMFCERGYTGTTMPAVAESAGIALDTVYASVGKKPALFALLVESAISGADVAVPAEEREYVRAIKAEPDAARKLEIYAAALRSIQERLAPLFRVLQEAAPLEAKLDDLKNKKTEQHTRNKEKHTKEKAQTGKIRRDLTIDMVAD